MYHQKPSRSNTQLQSTDVNLAFVLRALYAFLDPKSLIIFALIVTCFCLWWCEVLFCHKGTHATRSHCCSLRGVAVIISEWNDFRMKDRERQSANATLWCRTKTRKRLYQLKSIKSAAGETIFWMLFSTSEFYFCLDHFPVTIVSCYYLAVQDFLDCCRITSTGEHHSTPFLYIQFKWASNYDKSIPKLGLRWSRIPGDSES